MVQPTLSLSESAALTVLRSFLLGVLPANTEVFKGEVNRVPEPISLDFAVFWPIANSRLSTNVVTYQDNIVTASIAGTIMTVSGVTRGSLAPGMVVRDEGALIAVDTSILSQLSGSTGGTGTYRLSASQTLGTGVIMAGVRSDMVPSRLVVQIDVHGPNSTDNAKVIEGLFRSEYATAAMSQSGLEISPLYSDEPKQIPFINAEQSYEYRWVIEVHLQINPIIGTPQQFADELIIEPIPTSTYP